MSVPKPNFSLNYQHQTRVELNLDNPIFVFYICVNGMSRQFLLKKI